MKKKVQVALFLLCAICMQLMGSVSVAAKGNAPIPKLVSVKQMSPNTIRITYDRGVDPKKGVNSGNYWIQSTTEQEAVGIASLGKDEQVSNENALTADKVSILPVDNTNQSFDLKFKQPIGANQKYNIIICYITAPDAPEYTGDNGKMLFIGK